MTTDQMTQKPARRRQKATAKPHYARPAAATKVATQKRAPTKKAKLQRLLARPKGATLAQLGKDLGWQPHTVRAEISRLRKRGTEVHLDKGGKTPTYRIVPAG